MNIRTIFFIFLLSIFLFSLAFGEVNYTQTMVNYCSSPPFATVAVPPNVLFVVDVSGSMSWCAYNPKSNKKGCCDSSSGCGWTYKEDEEGYFDPDKVYRYNSSEGYWEETTGTPSSCPKRYSDINKSRVYKGSCLNFLYMSRIDLVRWAITGGKPKSCTGSHRYNPKWCDPELYGEPNSHLSCDSNGCILETSIGEKVKVPWSRINDALAYKFKEFSLQPRIGVLFYSSYGVRSHKVYIGDFTGSNNFDAINPYKNTISYFNSEAPGGGTPTGPAMWDAYNYFAQNSPEYGGFTPQQGEGDKWKNPMYQCKDTNENGQCEGSELEFVPCAKNFVILLSDGQWNVGGTPGNVRWTCSINTGFERHSADPVVPAYWMHKKGFTNAKTGVKSYIESVYAIGLFLGGTGAESLKKVAMYGFFDVRSGKMWPDDLSDYPKDTCYMDDCGNGKGSACGSLPASSSDWDKDGDGIPDTFYSASNAVDIKNAILNAILDILKRASSGTSVAVLSTSTRGSGFMCQAYFFSRKSDEKNKEFSWIGELKGLWVDEFGQIREDSCTTTSVSGAVSQLELDQDKVLNFYNDEQTNEIIVHLFSSNSEGKVISPCSYDETKSIEDINAIWNIGKKLWERDPSSRNIKTSIDGLNFIDFSVSNSSDLKSFLRAYDEDDAKNIIKYISGEDVDICLDSDNGTCNLSGHRDRNLTINSVSHIWKLGDIIQSTPRLLSRFPLNTYHIVYTDTTYEDFIKNRIKNRKDYLFVGSNDGMLHCFYLGKIESVESDPEHPGLRAALMDPENKIPGTELWAYIPMNVLPYLKYLAYPDYDNCHIYYVDQRVLLFDASINGTPNDDKTENSWKTILIGALRFGGSPNPPSDSPVVNSKKVGLSSIFAIDITDPENPSLLWEFSDPDLGFTTSYPTVVRVGDRNKNGNWYLVFGSGPTDYDGDVPPSHGYIYVLNLKTGELVGKISVGSNTYVGDCVAVDPDFNYNVDAIYCGTVIKDNNNLTGKMLRILTSEDVPNVNENKEITNWSVSVLVDAGAPITAAPDFTFDEKGNLWVFFGTGKYFGQKDKVDSSQQYLFGVKDTCWKYNGTNWGYSNCSVISNIIDVTGMTVSGEIEDYFCRCEGGSVDCCEYNAEGDCVTPAKDTDPDGNPICNCGDLVISSLKNVTVSGCIGTDPVSWSECVDYISSKDGWKRKLSVSSPAERCISKPAVIGQVTMFTTFKPNDDICGYGGDTYLYSLYYKAGIPYKQPIILEEGGATIEEDKSVTLFSSVEVGKGAPPLGESISTKQVKSKTETYVQLSTGEVVKIQQKPVFLPNKIQYWIER